MRDLHELLREKELTIKRLEKEIEAIRVVLGIIEEDDRRKMADGRTATQALPATPPPAPLSVPPAPAAQERGYSAASQNGLPPGVSIPFSVPPMSAAPASAASAAAAPRRTDRTNWP